MIADCRLPIADSKSGNGNGKHNGDGHRKLAVQLATLTLRPSPEELEIHQFCDCIPGLAQEELNRLAEDIRRAGRTAPFLTAGGKIIERDRFLACKAAKVPVELEAWDGYDSLAETVARLNLPRLYLSESQRACVAVPLAEQISLENSARRTRGLKRGQESDISAFLENPPVSLILGSRGKDGAAYVKSAELAAKICHVSRAYVELANKLREQSRDIFGMVLAGKLNLSQGRLLASKNSRADQLSNIQLDSVKHDPNWIQDELIVGDCLLKMPKMKDKSFPLIFADPPYNNGWKYDADPSKDKIPEERYLEISERWMRQCARLLTPNGSLFVMIDGNYQGRFDVKLRNIGLNWRDTIVWHDNNPEYTESKFLGAARFILYFTKSPTKMIWNADAVREPSARDLLEDSRRVHDRGRVLHNVWDVPRIAGNAAERVPFEDAPPQTPQKILRRIVLAASNPGDRVFDPFAGNGTTWRAAREAGRRFTGIERSKLYAEQARAWVQASALPIANCRLEEASERAPNFQFATCNLPLATSSK